MFDDETSFDMKKKTICFNFKTFICKLKNSIEPIRI
jgi:hypothetical protein